MLQQKQLTAESKLWKNLFLITGIFILVIMPLISRYYGQSGDEWLQIQYGEHIWNYFFKGDKQALDYSNKSLQYQGIEYYGGLFDYIMDLLHRAMPSVDILSLRHFCNAITGALLMIFTGLIAQRLSKKWSVAFMALLFMIFSPRIFGESMNNPKDIPFAMGFAMGIYYFLGLLENMDGKKWRYALGVAVAFGISFGVRPAGGLMHIGYFAVMAGLYYFTQSDFRERLKADKSKNLKALSLYMIGALIIGYVIGLSAWPWGLQDPISRPLESLKAMTNIKIPIRVLFEGAMHYNNAMPPYYEFKWIMMSNPLIVILLTIAFPVLYLLGKNRYNLFIPAFLLFAALFPPIYMILKKSSVHDTWRHLFFIYPYWVIMAALSVDMISERISNVKLKPLAQVIAVVGLLPAIIWTFRSHPNQYVYFNEAVGGIKGAFGYYEIDYYQNSGKQDADWIIKNAQPVAGRRLQVLSNMSDFSRYFEKDTARFRVDYGRFPERHMTDWDYYVTYSRFIAPEVLQNGKWPPKDAVHIVSVDGVPLSAVLKRTNRDGIAAAAAYEKKDFATAVPLYAAYTKAEPEDEIALLNYGIALASTGRIDEGITAVNQAISVDPSRAEYYQLLAQLYQAKGDMANAQKANGQAQEIIYREQANEPEAE